MPARKALVATALVAGAIGAAPAEARPVDLRSPDARDSATRVQPQAEVDLRSPDARDAGSAPATLETAPATLETSPAPQRSAPVVADGFDWVSAAVGAGAITLLAFCVVATSAGRRRWHSGLAA